LLIGSSQQISYAWFLVLENDIPRVFVILKVAFFIVFVYFAQLVLYVMFIVTQEVTAVEQACLRNSPQTSEELSFEM
jgi:hypothetical protein